MKACEALAKLKQCVNIEYYIGPKAAAEIEKACADKPKKEPKPVAKTTKVSED
jgi:hypothetical protein